VRTSSIICVDVAWEQIVEKLHSSHTVFHITIRWKQMKWTGQAASTRDMRSDLNIIRTWIKNAVGIHRRRKDDIRMKIFLSWFNSRSWPLPALWGSSITIRHTTVGRTPLDEWSAQRRYFYLTTHNTHKTETSVFPAGFKPRIPASERR